jgi:hypothetical protein
LIGLFACVIGMLILAWGLSKRPHWYQPTGTNREVELYGLGALGPFRSNWSPMVGGFALAEL